MRTKLGKCENCPSEDIEITFTNMNDSWLCSACMDYLIETYLENFGY